MAYEQGMNISYVNVVVDGHEHEVLFEEIDVSEHPTSEELKGALETHLGLGNGALRNYEVDGYSATGQVVVRPDSKLGVEDEMTIRTRIMDSLLRCPHRDMTLILALHQEMMEEDPEFYAHFAVWAMKNTKVRDHKEAI